MTGNRLGARRRGIGGLFRTGQGWRYGAQAGALAPDAGLLTGHGAGDGHGAGVVNGEEGVSEKTTAHPL
ncbi:hypothetical protein [Streptomyces sp. NPDC020362]|uniref:hypothetical protein n=1 Tax=unclassified Streptomyces TaxID=2593676 RepID=UPI000AD32F00